ncbi:hypothetical protein DFJ58DRAFT_843092 [Suillus subalutaceus]|uniref:uncharacterized protein n=1 Tax=Suillus subalutaceus TaxID=48586 RepID=UPI001B86B801|nr:uncharacterized protein DFJ58DRAFT_843092 [Suillus subalutaceus]KAG1847638.1 hypothetical protein DFJ58DRAFT_843092 [Suillus subalutaceus]
MSVKIPNNVLYTRIGSLFLELLDEEIKISIVFWQVLNDTGSGNATLYCVETTTVEQRDLLARLLHKSANHASHVPAEFVVPTRHPIYYFNVSGHIFQVENTLYKLCSSILSVSSNVFHDMFSTMENSRQPEVDGMCDDKPIHHNGISRETFELFLEFTFGRMCTGSHSIDELSKFLRFCDMNPQPYDDTIKHFKELQFGRYKYDTAVVRVSNCLKESRDHNYHGGNFKLSFESNENVPALDWRKRAVRECGTS